MANTEAGVSLQQDTLSPVAGGPIRTINVWVPNAAGQLVQVQQQAVVLADPNGVLVADPNPAFAQMIVILEDIKEVAEDLRMMMAAFVGTPVIDNQQTVPSNPNITQ